MSFVYKSLHDFFSSLGGGFFLRGGGVLGPCSAGFVQGESFSHSYQKPKLY